jgi:Phosphoenolpyruvate carboxykinase
MKDALYIHDQTAVINFSAFFPQSADEILSHESFKHFLDLYLSKLSSKEPKRYAWILQGKSQKQALIDLVRFLKLVLVLDLSEIDHPLLQDKTQLTYLIEDAYNEWRTLQRISILKVSSSNSGQVTNFMDADSRYNALVLTLYRGIQEKVQGTKNRVYRQLQAGTNASMVLKDVKWTQPTGYEYLKGIPFVDQLLLRTPLLLHPKSNKRSGSFQPVAKNPLSDIEINREQYFCYPAKVGELLILVYVHYDHAFSGISNANLFELANKEEILHSKIDGIMIFGYEDGSDSTVYHYDETNDLWTAKVSYNDKISYFGYMKKMMLTMHNAIMMKKGHLPIHGSMINVQFKDREPIGVVFVGDSGAGKSETIEAIQLLGHQELVGMDVIFDDMGSFLIENGKVLAQGTEIGAFIRLDDLDKGSPYRTMDRSIFMNPESPNNARVIIPVASYENIVKKHPVHYFFYANNYVNQTGFKVVKHASDIKDVFVEGKRMAMATTHETGISTTYFANPFGPMQDQKTCDPLLDQYFKALDESHVKTGEVYTGLGVKDSVENHLSLTAQAILDELLKN